jgi:Zn-dependent protease
LLQIPFWFVALWLFMHVVPQSVLLSNDPNSWVRMVIIALSNGIIINAVLAAFNMIPFPPLDGHYILEGLGPPFVTDVFNAIRPYGFMLIFMLSFIPQSMKVLDAIIEPVYRVAVMLIGIALGAR